MADNIYDLSATAASNTTIASVDVSGATGKVKDGDNVMRALGAYMAQVLDDLGGVNTVGGTGDAVTVTLASGVTAYATGQVFTFKAGASNTGAATLNVNSIGAKAIRKIIGGTDVALSAGDIQSGRRISLIYDSTANSSAGAWILVNPSPVVELLSTVSASSSASVAFTLPSGFDTYEVRITGMLPASQSVLVMQVSTDGGSNYANSAYKRSAATRVSGSASETITSSASDSDIPIGAPSTNISNTSGEQLAATIDIFKTTRFRAAGKVVTLNTSSEMMTSDFEGSYGSGAVDAIRFIMDSGNIATGTFKLYGYR